MARENVDVFVDAPLRSEWIPPRKRSLSYAFGSSRRSLFGLVCDSLDAEAALLLASKSSELSTNIFREHWTRLADAAVDEIEQGVAQDFCQAILPKLDPPAPDPGAHLARMGGSCADRLAQAAIKTRRFEWIPLAARLHRQATGNPMSLPDALRQAVERSDLGTLAALREAGICSPSQWEQHAQKLAACSDPALQELGLSLARQAFQERFAAFVQERKRWAELRGQDLASYEPAKIFDNVGAALWPGAEAKTTPAWLALHLELGVAPFEPPAAAAIAPAARLLVPDWRKAMPYADRDDPAKRLGARRGAEDQILPLLRSMIEASPESAGERWELGPFDSDIQRMFSKARKIDALCLCVAQGFYGCADALVEAGVDWKFAAKQCSAGFAPREGQESIQLAQAYFEGLAVREASLKSSARKAAKDAKAGVAPPAPAPTFRL